ncbi:MAG: hypothetical protein JXQ93_01740 [Flavobacteriaceae bacterium]
MKYFYFFVVLILCISCDETVQEKKDKQIATSENSLAKDHDAILEVNVASKKEISKWMFYSNLSDFLVKFKKSTSNEALSNALELGSLIKVLKDSTKPKPLDTPSVLARINLLETESLRLSDMTKISVIKAEEVHDQVNKVIQAFSALNSKINTVFLQQNLDRNINLKDFKTPVFNTIRDTFSQNRPTLPKKSLLTKPDLKEKKGSKKLPSKGDLLKYSKKKPNQ